MGMQSSHPYYLQPIEYRLGLCNMVGFTKYKTADRIFHIKGCMDAFVTLIIGDKKAMLIDTGYGILNIREYVESLTGLPLIIINTHGHIDHINGNYQFDEVYLHPNDFDASLEHSAKDWKQRVVQMAKDRNVLPEHFNEEAYVNSGRGNVLPLTEKTFDLGGITLEVIATPGHTIGSICMLVPKERLLITGDTLNTQLFLFLTQSTSLKRYIDTLEGLKKLDFDKMIISHYYAPVPKSRIDSNIACAKNIDIAKSEPITIGMLPDYSPLNYIHNVAFEPSGYPDIPEKGQIDGEFPSILFTLDRL